MNLCIFWKTELFSSLEMILDEETFEKKTTSMKSVMQFASECQCVGKKEKKKEKSILKESILCCLERE